MPCADGYIARHIVDIMRIVIALAIGHYKQTLNSIHIVDQFAIDVHVAIGVVYCIVADEHIANNSIADGHRVAIVVYIIVMLCRMFDSIAIAMELAVAVAIVIAQYVNNVNHVHAAIHDGRRIVEHHAVVEYETRHEVHYEVVQYIAAISGRGDNGDEHLLAQCNGDADIQV